MGISKPLDNYLQGEGDSIAKREKGEKAITNIYITPTTY